MALALVATPVQGQSWIPVGAPGGNVRALAQDPHNPLRAYLGTAEGLLYRSDDGGIVWHRLNPGFPRRGCSLDAIAVDPRGVVFLGYWEVHGHGGGVARSTDEGRTFDVLKGVEGESVRSLALAPSDPSVIAAGTLNGVFLSRDGGHSWARITPQGNPALRNIESLVFDPSHPEILYAGTWHLTWKTGDGGASWAPAHTGMIDDSDVMTLTIAAQNPETVYATACSGIYRSTDGALQWNKLDGIPFSSRRTRAFALGKDNPELLLAGTTEGLWISRDGGDSWLRVTPGDLVINAVLMLPSGDILLGTDGAGVLRSKDRGRTWITSNTGFSERFVFRLQFDNVGRCLVVAVWGAPHYGGVFVSPGIGGPWKRLGRGMDGRQVLSLALVRDTILAGTDDGIFVRAPGETAWSRLRTRLNGREVHPRVTELLALPRGRILAATPDGLLRSTDGGRSWALAALGSDDEVTGLALAPDQPDRIVAATVSGFFRSRDAGETWTQISTGLGGVTPHALAFVPSDGSVLFVTTSGGLFRSGDQGATWRRVDGGVPHSDLTGIAISRDGRTIYASDFTWGGIFRSIDGGLAWDRVTTDGLSSDRVWALILDPAAPDRLLAAPSGGGLHLLIPALIATSR